MSTIANAERSFRQFLRATFKARMSHDEDGHFITTVKGKTAKAQIQNPNTVLAVLYDKAKVVKETNKAVTFAYQEGKKGPQAEITVSLTEDHMLTMVSKH